MKTQIECFPCFLRQTVIALKQLYGVENAQHGIVRDVLAIMQQADVSKPPAYTTTFIHRAIRNGLQQDPFEKIKAEFNEIALGLYPALKQRVAESADPLWTASRLAIAGNIIDFGIFTSVDIEGSVSRALAPGISRDDYASFREDLGKARRVLYLLDNAGEIVFDRLLIEELCAAGMDVTAVVKGGPVLNDVTIADARQAGIDRVCRVIDNGSDAIGTILEWTSPGFREEMQAAELIVSKGQGNFETLEPSGKRTYYLFQSKCDVVSAELGVAKGSMLLLKA
ncbi:MAG: ARMT1-like domain-containing protein [Thermodesulfovibrionales bacterium]